MKTNVPFASILICFFLLSSCTSLAPSGIFGKRSPHEHYGQKLSDAGLRSSVLGKLWFSEAQGSLDHPLSISIPYKETGYFGAERPRAIAFKFEAKRGQRISVSLQKKPIANFAIYVDLWELRKEKTKKLLASADTNSGPFSHDLDDEGTYLLRLQPELLSSGEYTLTIVAQPSLAFPVTKGKIGSFWGDSRDDGVRKHEGIDIFAAKRTPALAAAEGVVNRVGENTLGGKVVFMRPEGKAYSLYYAHLDEQLVSEGQKVKLGDTIGLVGNTGNARHTLPHLHFGIYTGGGAVDPVAFVDPEVKRPVGITASLSTLGKSMRVANKSASLMESPSQKANTLLKLRLSTLVLAEAANANWYRVQLPDGMQGYIVSSALIGSSAEPVKHLTLTKDSALLEKPNADAPRKHVVSAGSVLKILGVFNDFYFVSANENSGWINL